MATSTPPQPSSEEADRIVGERLEAELIDAGLEPRAARAMQHALQLVVLRMLLVLASKQDLREAVNDHRRETRWQFYILFALMLMLLATVLSSLFV